MDNGKSIYTFQLNCDFSVVDNLIQDYLKKYNFQLIAQYGEQFYIAGDGEENRYIFFNYFINGQTLTIEAWIESAASRIPIESVLWLKVCVGYRNSLLKLFQEIEKLNSESNIIDNKDNSKNQNYKQSMKQNDQFTKSFQEELVKKNEKMCELGFWLSIFLGLLYFFVGIVFEIVYVLNFYFALQGLNTRKRGKAIATIVITIISIIIMILNIIM